MDSSTRIYCGPVKQLPFAYDGEHFTANGISRSGSDEILKLLTWTDPGPVMTKKGKPRVHQPPKHKDPTGDFYLARCIHYGLKEFKSKAASKNELLRALNRNHKKLTVPPSLQVIEQKLKLDFQIANEEARKEYHEEKSRRQAQEAHQQTKRKREDDEMLEEIVETASKKSKVSNHKSFDITWFAGTYKVVSPNLREGYGSYNDDAFSLSFARLDADTIYGEFDFGCFEGYMRSVNIDVSTHTITFNWHGRETGEGESSFGDDNIISVTFVDDEDLIFTGHAEGGFFGKCEIFGKQTNSNYRGPGQVRAGRWKYQYDQLNEDNYEYERRSRW